MKLSLLLILLLSFLGYTQEQKYIYIDENGNEVSYSEYQSKRIKLSDHASSWSQIIGNKRYFILKEDLYLKGVFNYQEIKTQLELIIRKNIPENNIILLSYFYKDDLCTSRWDNEWTVSEIIERKKFTNTFRKNLAKENITYIVLFEKGMTLKNNPKRKREYFYIDKNKFFRNKFFVSPTTCGSYALIKPNGQTLIRNGEYRADMMADHLDKEYWNTIFPTED